MAARGLWKGSISFGLLNIPVILQSAEEDKGIHFRMLDEKNLAPVRFRRVNAQDGEEVPYQRIIKGYEFEPGHFVTFTPDDIKAANPKATQTIDIEDFVALEDIDTLLFERPYYLLPQKNGEKGYALLRDALDKSQKVAIGKVVIRTKQHLAAIMPRGQYLILELLRFAHQVRQVEEADFLEDKKKTGYSSRELQMAQALIEGMTADWEPEKYRDTYYEDLIKAIEQKVKTGKVAHIEEEGKAPPATTNVVDLLPLLKESLAQTTRPKTKRGGKNGGRRPKRHA